MQLVYIIGDSLGIIGCFGSSSYTLTQATQLGVISPQPVSRSRSTPHLPLLNPSHCEAFSVASRMSLLAFLLCFPQMPRSIKTWCKDLPAKPLQTTSIGFQRAFHPFLRLSATKSKSFSLFLSCASYILSFQGTVSSRSTTCLLKRDISTMSGLSVMGVMNCGIRNCLPGSTKSCQSVAVESRPPWVFFEV